MLHLCIHHKDVAFGINEDIARNKVPYFVGVVLIATWTWHAQVEDIHHGNPIAIGFGHLFSSTLFNFKTAYLCLAISKLRFMYCAKSLELIGDCCDAAIFRILRSVTSLWNWLRNVIIHNYLNYIDKDTIKSRNKRIKQ